MAKIYILESAQEKREVQTSNGILSKQQIVLRDIDGDSQYTRRYAVEYVGPGDLLPYVGHVVATCLTERYSKGEKGDFNNIQCREVISLGMPNN